MSKGRALNFNTLLMAVTIGLLSYFGKAAMDKLDATNSNTLIIGTKIEALGERVKSLEQKMDESTPRREFDIRMAEIQAKFRQIDLDILQLRRTN